MEVRSMVEKSKFYLRKYLYYCELTASGKICAQSATSNTKGSERNERYVVGSRRKASLVI